MLPTLRPGDRLLVDRRAYRNRLPELGDIVVLMDPARTDRWLIKRVGAVGPGRFWKTPTGPLPAATALGRDASPPGDAVETVELPAATVYVIGDAPSARDSRQFGPVRTESLIGRAYRCYAPPDRRRAL